MAWDCPRFWKLEILWESVYFLVKSIFVKISIYHRNLLGLRSFWQNMYRDCWKWTQFATIETGAQLWSREFWSLWALAGLQVAPAVSWQAGCLSWGCEWPRVLDACWRNCTAPWHRNQLWGWGLGVLSSLKGEERVGMMVNHAMSFLIWGSTKSFNWNYCQISKIVYDK